MGNTSDEALVGKARGGDMDAFKTLVVRHEGKVAGIVRSLIGATPLAEDIGQEVFVRFYDSLDKYREHTTVDRYLIRIALRLSLHELKRRTKSKAQVSQEVLERTNGRDHMMGLIEQLQHEFSKMDPETQSVISLRLVEGFSVEETAELLDLNVNTVLTRLAKAQHDLRNALSINLM